MDFKQNGIHFITANLDPPDVMKSNRKLDVALDGRLLSDTTNLNAFVLTPTVPNL